ncbi:hypothetical protein MPLDJ20_20192 [Mesorhizobium plurifarium]|uniref:Uncharacterized protein n=1 Tax=Mesorhizobium plurifarium TaxID=69974 RepID=A0A090EVC3_MESPL|nr:hypothetical protein MPLDJ20_20192 [Mesorhizobium plurifarium]
MRFLDNVNMDFVAEVIGVGPAEAVAASHTQDEGYYQAASTAFEDMKYVVALLTAILLTDFASSDRGALGAGFHWRLAEPLEGAKQSLMTSRATTQGARHHRHHLVVALEKLDAIAGMVRDGADMRDDPRCASVMAGLRQVVRELRTVSKLAAGFDVVNFATSCCATHAKPHQFPGNRVQSS